MSDDQTLLANPDDVPATPLVETPVVPAATVVSEPVAVPAAPVVAEPVATGYAVVETGGKQYRVKVGDRIRVEKLVGDDGSDIIFDRVLMLGGSGDARIGLPTVTGASVTARIEGQERGEKLVVFKYKPKKRYRRRIGHRQSLTQLTVTAINS